MTADVAARANAVVAELRAVADADPRVELADRYGIHTDRALGIPMRRIKQMAAPQAPTTTSPCACGSQGSTSDTEFTARAAFALLWALALHDRDAPDDQSRSALHLVQNNAADGRRLVTKAQTMALRAIATKRPEVRDDVTSASTPTGRCRRRRNPASWPTDRQGIRRVLTDTGPRQPTAGEP